MKIIFPFPFPMAEFEVTATVRAHMFILHLQVATWVILLHINGKHSGSCMSSPALAYVKGVIGIRCLGRSCAYDAYEISSNLLC